MKEDELDLDIGKNDNMEIKDVNGNLVFENMEWDEAKMHGIKVPKAELETFVSLESGTAYSFTGMLAEDAKEYIKDIIEAGFTYNIFEMDEYNYSGMNEEGAIINFYYDNVLGEGTILSGKGEVPSSVSNNGGVFETVEVKWESNIIGGIPDPGTKLTAFATEEGATYYTFENLENYTEFVELIKSSGFTVDVNEVVGDNYYTFTAFNSEGDDISFITSENGSTINYTSYD
jgi:hypothetical protein